MKYISIISLITISLTILWSSSCQKESFVEYTADTSIVSKVYQTIEGYSTDAVIESLYPNTNFGSTPHLAAFSWTSGGSFNTSRILIKFDLSDIPPQTKISKASLSLFYSPYGNLNEQSGNNAFTIYRISDAWNENTVTWANQPTFTNTDAINIFESTKSDQSYTDIDVTAKIQEMINHPTENYGFMIKLDEEFPYSLLIIASSSHAVAEKRPKLVVEF